MSELSIGGLLGLILLCFIGWFNNFIYIYDDSEHLQSTLLKVAMILMNCIVIPLTVALIVYPIILYT